MRKPGLAEPKMHARPSAIVKREISKHHTQIMGSLVPLRKSLVGTTIPPKILPKHVSAHKTRNDKLVSVPLLSKRRRR